MKAKDVICTIFTLAAEIFFGCKLIGTEVPTYFNYVWLGGMFLVPLIFSDNIINVIKKWTE